MMKLALRKCGNITLKKKLNITKKEENKTRKLQLSKGQKFQQLQNSTRLLEYKQFLPILHQGQGKPFSSGKPLFFIWPFLQHLINPFLNHAKDLYMTCRNLCRATEQSFPTFQAFYGELNHRIQFSQRGFPCSGSVFE